MAESLDNSAPALRATPLTFTRLLRMVHHRFIKFHVGLLIVVTSGFATSASAQQDWLQNYPPPVRVAPIDGLAREQAASLARSTYRLKYKQSAVQVVQTAHVEHPPSPPPSIEYDQASYVDNQAPPHLVIQSPQLRTAVPRDSAVMGPSDENGVRYLHDRSHSQSAETPHRLPHHRHLPELPGVENDPSGAGPGHLGLGTHWLRNQPQPTIPGATVQPSWKTPYSYGYFGSSGKRHWTRQYGYRDRYRQWTLR